MSPPVRVRSRRAAVLGLVALAVVAAVTWAVGATVLNDEGGDIDDALGFRPNAGFLDLEALADVETWLGREIGYTVQFAERESPEGMRGSIFGHLVAEDAALPTVADRIDLSMAVPLAFGTANARSPEGVATIRRSLEDVADGAVDEDYRVVATRLVEAGHGDAIIRLGYEFSAAWPPWSSQGNEDAFVRAWRHVHGVFREVSPDFRFDWTSTLESFAEHAPAAYPGDEYVDMIGIDVYHRPADGQPLEEGEFDEDFAAILRQHADFAIERDKPVSYPEWGMRGVDDTAFIRGMHDWMASLPSDGGGRLLYHSYFSTARGYEITAYPRARDEFRRLFGEG